MNPKSLLVVSALALLLSSCQSRKAVSPQYVPDGGITSAQTQKPAPKQAGMNGGEARRLVEEARRWIGTPYRYGGEDLSGADCSGMVMRVYEKALARKLPRTSAEQHRFCVPVRREDLADGDLVFFSSKGAGTNVSHVGIYVGKGRFVHASTSKGVIESSLDEDYYLRHYHSAGRVAAIGPAKAMEMQMPQKPVIARREEEEPGKPSSAVAKQDSAASIRSEVRRAMVW